MNLAEELLPWVQNVNGWYLATVAEHGPRAWYHDQSGTVRVEGADRLTEEQYADFMACVAGFQSHPSVPIDAGDRLSDEDLRDLVMMDREVILTWGWDVPDHPGS